MNVPKFVKDSLEPFRDMTDLQIKVLKINPFGAQTFSASGTRDITFKLPRDHFLVGDRSYFYFKAEADGDGAGDDEFMSDIHTIFDNYRAEVGSQEVLNEQEFGWFRTLEFDAYASSTDRTSASSTVMNIPDNSTSGTAKKFRIPLASKWNSKGFFKDIKPLYKMDQVTLEWRINNTLAEYTTATTAVTSVDITNCELELYMIDSPTLRKLFDTDIVKSFTTHYHYHATLASGATQLSVNIPASMQNLRGLAMLMRNSADPTDPNWETGTSLENYKYTNAFVLNALTKFSVSIDGKQYPDKEIDGSDGTELVSNLERYWNVDRLGDWFDNATLTATDGKGYYAISFSGTEEGVTGLSLVSKSGTVVVNANLTAGVNTDLDFFLRYDKFYKISKNGDFSVTK